MSCPRLFTKEQLLVGLKVGRAIYIDREDAPELDELYELKKQGLIDFQLIRIDEQTMIAKFWWSVRNRN